MQAALARIMLVDDDVSMHEDMAVVLCLGEDNVHAVEQAARSLISSFSAEDALREMRAAKIARDPLAVVFVKLSVELDGVELARLIWEENPATEVVLFSDCLMYSFESVVCKLGLRPNLMFMQKPFEFVAIQQIVLNLSQKWQLAQQQQRYRDELEAIVEQRTRELRDSVMTLEKLKNKAEALTQSKSLFLSKMSHELRTPLNGILGFLQVLKGSMLSVQQTKIADQLEKSGRNMATIINDLLEFSRVEAGALTFEQSTFDLHDLAAEVADLSAVLLNDKPVEIGLIFEPGLPRMVVGDPFHLRKILLNLLSNAVKFTHEGEIVLTLAIQPVIGGSLKGDELDGHYQLRVQVQDTGIGMTQEQQNNVFQPYVQSDPSIIKRYGGTGLGLCIVRQMSELLGGQVRLYSEAMQGTRVVATIDIKWGAEQQLESVQNCVLFTEHQTTLACLQASQDYWAQSNRAIFVPCLITAWNNGELQALIAQAAKPFQSVLFDPRTFVLIDHGELLTTMARCLVESNGNAQLFLLLPMARLNAAYPLVRSNTVKIIHKPVKPHELAMLTRHQAAIETLDQPIDHNQGLEAQLARGNWRILVVDDNETNTLLVQSMLARAKIQTQVVHSGAAAIEQASQHFFDLILMDCNMPGLTGYQASASIRAAGLNTLTPILALTAEHRPQDNPDFAHSGMNGAITKPLEMDLLFECLLHYLPDPELP